jgi:hypothetical protein
MMFKLFLLDGLLDLLGPLHHDLAQACEDPHHIKIVLLQGRWLRSCLGLASPLNEFLAVHYQLLLQLLDPLILNKSVVVFEQKRATIRLGAPILDLESLPLILEELVEHFPDNRRRGVLIDLEIADLDVSTAFCGPFDVQLFVPCLHIGLLLIHGTSSSTPSLLDPLRRRNG